MKKHICQQSRTCCCSILGLEPNEKCPIHGAGEWPPRCEICGRFMRHPKQDPQPVARYSFELTPLTNGDAGDCDIIVTRNEWAPFFSVIDPPTSVEKLKMELRKNSTRMCPVPPDKTFRRIPEEEREHLISVAKAYAAGLRRDESYVYWEYR